MAFPFHSTEESKGWRDKLTCKQWPRSKFYSDLSIQVFKMAFLSHSMVLSFPDWGIRKISWQRMHLILALEEWIRFGQLFTGVWELLQVEYLQVQETMNWCQEQSIFVTDQDNVLHRKYYNQIKKHNIPPAVPYAQIFKWLQIWNVFFVRISVVHITPVLLENRAWEFTWSYIFRNT